MLNYHAKFIKGYHSIAAPLERLCGAVDRAPDWRTRCWTDSCEAAFQRLRQAMTEVNATQQHSRSMQAAFERGEVALTDVVVAMEKSSLAFAGARPT